MRRGEMADLTAFAVVAEERNFTRAAARLGMSQSALSQIIRRLEAHLGLRLLTRTTRSMAPTQAGEQLLETLVPALGALDARIATLTEMREKPAGLIRITSVEHATATILYPALARLLADYPDIRVEIVSDYGLADIVADRFDAGVRLGEDVDKDMIALRIAPDLQIAIVASPAYLERVGAPMVPQDLVRHQCINLRISADRGFYIWDFEKDRHALRVRVDGQMAFNTIDMLAQAALDGFGLAHLPLDQVEHHLASGRLVRVLEDWSRPLPGYHLYYPSRRQPTAAFAMLVKTLRYRE
ncbi:LysR family transcriptional regulator [Novosphingobium sp.]|uniref:LysR family transcriptional regulator n=1 Tax=Novosphingobium sp. TaxID=1874826 RepID=UPI0031E24419